MDVLEHLTYEAMLGVFTPSRDRRQRIGVELECGLIDPHSGQCVPYWGEYGSGRLLASIAQVFGGEPQCEAGAMLSVALPNGAQCSLELGGALEYSSPPLISLADLVEVTRRDLGRIADLARTLRIAVLPGGMLPFTAVESIPWIPKPRVQIMREYFRDLGPAAASAEAVMGLTLSAHTTFDYLSEADFAEKLRLLVRAAPVAAALFVNSPLEAGLPAGQLSRRMRLWQHVDPSRCGVLGFADEPGLSAGTVVEWALRLPMIYRAKGDRHVRAPRRTFAELIRHGFEDGARPGRADWRSHLSQVWPQVRPRHTLEVRAPDGLNWADFAAVPAFWTGLVYDASVRRDALTMLDAYRLSELDALVGGIATGAMWADLRGEPVGVAATELLRLADRGLRARVANGVEPPAVVGYLDPLWNVAKTGISFAEQVLADWAGPLGERPSAFVEKYRI